MAGFVGEFVDGRRGRHASGRFSGRVDKGWMPVVPRSFRASALAPCDGGLTVPCARVQVYDKSIFEFMWDRLLLPHKSTQLLELVCQSYATFLVDLSRE